MFVAVQLGIIELSRYLCHWRSLFGQLSIVFQFNYTLIQFAHLTRHDPLARANISTFVHCRTADGLLRHPSLHHLLPRCRCLRHALNAPIEFTFKLCRSVIQLASNTLADHCNEVASVPSYSCNETASICQRGWSMAQWTGCSETT